MEFRKGEADESGDAAPKHAAGGPNRGPARTGPGLTGNAACGLDADVAAAPLAPLALGADFAAPAAAQMTR